LENRRTGSASGTCARLLHLIAQKRLLAPACSLARGDRAVLGGGCGITEPGRADDADAAGLRIGEVCRLKAASITRSQQTHAYPRQRWQWREGSLARRLCRASSTSI
jgi:hypothetical protein